MPHEYATNVDDVAAAIVAQIETFGFTATHEGRALGHLLAESTAQGIIDRSREKQCDGEGRAWPVNSEPYRTRKLRNYKSELTNYRTGQMLSRESLMGKVIITQYLATIIYGTGQSPARSAGSGGYFDRLADNLSDDDKSFYAHEQGRAFFQLDDEIKAANFALFSEALGAHMRETGR